MSESRKVVTVVIGRFEPLVAHGLLHVLNVEPFMVLASDLEQVALERAIARERPQMVILTEEVAYPLLAQLKSTDPAVRILVLARNPTPLQGTMLLANGATCVAANASPADLLAAARLAAEGGSAFLSADGQRVQRPSADRVRQLTRREAEVYKHLGKGNSDAVIALEMEISVGTVRAHVRAVFRKLNVKSRRELGT